MAKNQIGVSGIEIQGYDDIVSDIVNGTADVPGLVTIYGPDINLASNSPDGNMVNVLALSKEDVLQLCVGIYDSFDPDQAIGAALDALAQIYGLTRIGGSYTVTPVVITASGAATLPGLDDPTATPFTVSDGNGNEFYLKTTLVITVAGTSTVDFQAKEIGYIQATPNTITNIITVTPAITSVNNPAAATTTGQEQETDAAFRIRRQKSVGKPAQGAMDGLVGGLYEVVGLVQAVVYENVADTIDAHTVPAHGIWVITDGGADADVAAAIYLWRSAGVAMKGSTTLAITQSDGSEFTVAWDKAASQSLHVKFALASISGGSVDSAAAVTGLVALSNYGIHEAADITSIATLLHQVNPDLVVSSCQVSVYGTTWVNSVLPTTLDKKFVLTSTNITVL